MFLYKTAKTHMKSGDRLFELIHSMTPSEKRYFKVYASRHVLGDKNKYVILFDVINRMSDYDDAQLLRRLQNHKFVQYLPVAKNYLYKLILKSLRAFNADTSQESHLHEQLDMLYILRHKGLFEQCSALLKKGKKIALDNELHPFAVQFLELERQLLKRTQVPDYDRALESLLQQQQQQLDQQKNTLEYVRLWHKMHTYQKSKGMIRSESDEKDYRDIVGHELLQSEDKALSRRAKLYYFTILADCCQLEDNAPQAYRYSSRVLEMRERQLAADEPTPTATLNYVGALNNVIWACFRAEYYDVVPAYLEKLQAIQTDSTAAMVQIQERLLLFRLLHNRVTGRFEDSLHLVEQFSEFSQKHHQRMSAILKESIIFDISIVYFGLNRFDKAIEWLNVLLNIKVPARKDYYCIAKILNIVYHYEAGNWYLMDSVLRSTYRYLLKRKRLFRLEQIVIDIIRQTSKTMNAADIRQLFHTLLDSLNELMKDSYERNVFAYFDFITWLESKIQKRSFADLTRAAEARRRRLSGPHRPA